MDGVSPNVSGHPTEQAGRYPWREEEADREYRCGLHAVRHGIVSDLVADYGHFVVDECHHLSAVGFEAIAREARAQYMLGLSAMVTRKDGHHPIIFMQCGPTRHRVDAKKQASARAFDHKVMFRRTGFRLAWNGPDEKPAIQELYAKLAQDPARNDLIFDDILSALEAGRSPVVITERKDHLDLLAGRLSKFAKTSLSFVAA